MSLYKSFLFLILSLLLFLPFTNVSAADSCNDKFDCKLVNEKWQCGWTGVNSDSKDTCQQKCLCGRSGTNQKGSYMQCGNGFVCSSDNKSYSDSNESNCQKNCSGTCNKATTCVKPGLVPCGNPGQPNCTICDIFVLAQNIINFILIDIVPVAAALMAAIAGILYLFGGAMPKWRALGKKLFLQVVYGLIIIYISFIILNTVLALVAPESKKYFSVTEGGVKIQCLYPK